MIEYHPISAKNQSRLRQLGKRVLPGIFVGYASVAGGIWKGDIMIADIDWGAGKRGRVRSTCSKAQCKPSVIAKKSWTFYIPSSRWKSKIVRKRPRIPRTHSKAGTTSEEWRSEKELQGNSERSQPTDERKDDAEVWSMEGDFIHRHHVEPRVQLHVPKEETFPIPLKYTDVTKTTHTNLDVKQERRIDDYWNIDGLRDLSEYWTGFT